MKKFLVISAFLNLTLACCLVMTRATRPESAPVLAPVATVAAPESAHATNTVARPELDEPKVTPAPFHWNQLDAPDYHVYVKNLRAIGCPEATVRAIVSADVHAAFRFQINSMEQKLRTLATNAIPSPGVALDEESNLRKRLQAMPELESAEIADMLGLKPVPVEMADASGAEAAGNQPATAEVQPVAVPLIFQNVDTTNLNLTDDQLQAINDVRQHFLDQIGGANQDPNDPAYLARWQKAQPAADNMLRGLLGNQVYEQYQMSQLSADTASSSVQQ